MTRKNQMINGKKEGYWEIIIKSKFSGQILRIEKGSFTNGNKEGLWQYEYSNICLDENAPSIKIGDKSKFIETGLFVKGKKEGLWLERDVEIENLFDRTIRELYICPTKISLHPDYENQDFSKYIEESTNRLYSDFTYIDVDNILSKNAYLYDDYYNYRKGIYKNGKREGKWIIARVNSRIHDFDCEWQGLYKNNLKIGEWSTNRSKNKYSSTWGKFRNNKNYSKGFFKNGMKEGTWFYDESYINYKKGKKNSSAKLVSDDGLNRKSIELNYNQNILDGLCEETLYKLTQKQNWNKKNKNWEEILESTKVIKKNKGEYLKGRKSGIWTMEYLDSHTKEAIEYKDDERDGNYSQITYDDYGKNLIEEKGIYKKGIQEGEWVSSYIKTEKYSGGFHSRSFFKKGKLEGKSLFYNPYEDILYTQNYKNNKLDGFYKEVKQSKKILLKEGNYKNNQKIGCWNIYHENGQVKQKILYKNDIKIGIEENFNKKGRKTLTIEYNELGHIIKKNKHIKFWKFNINYE